MANLNSKMIIILIIILFSKISSIELNFSEELKRTESDYTECLKLRINGNETLSVVDKTYLVSIGTVLRLECNNLCLNISKSVDNIWVYMSAISLKITKRPKKTEILKDLSLEVVFRNESKSGNYYCIHNKIVYAVHRITIIDSEPFDLYFKKSESELNDKKHKNDMKSSVHTFIDWYHWSDCNRCPVGLKKRIGICKIRSTDPKFNGTPCRSPLLPKKVYLKEDIQKTRSMILFSICKKTCPLKAKSKDLNKLTKEEVKHKLNEWVDWFKNLKIEALFVGEKVVISCNTAFNATNLYVWRNYTTKLEYDFEKLNRFYYINPMKIHIKSKGRVKIDFMNNLVINYALKSDQRIYSCFDSIRNHSISLTKLLVRSQAIKKLTFWSAFKQYFAAVLVLITIILFGLTLWDNRNLMTKI